jgi:hypothetical protein
MDNGLRHLRGDCVDVFLHHPFLPTVGKMRCSDLTCSASCCFCVRKFLPLLLLLSLLLWSHQAPPVVVAVSGQVNAQQVGLFGYLAPALTGFLFPGCGDSSGGFVVAFTGRNFGPAAANLTLFLNRASGSERFPCAVVAHTHTSGLCVAAHGAGKDLPVSVEVAGRSHSGNMTTLRFSYDPPVVTAIVPVNQSIGACGQPAPAPGAGFLFFVFFGGTLVLRTCSAVCCCASSAVLSVPLAGCWRMLLAVVPLPRSFFCDPSSFVVSGEQVPLPWVVSSSMWKEAA